MKCRLLSTEDYQGWYDVLERLPETDIYFLPEYHRAHEANGKEGHAHAFVAEEGDDLCFYPFFMRPIERVVSGPVGERWHDIQTVYGYSGPLATTASETFLHRVWSAFTDWCQENRVIAEFIRFNPLIENQRYAGNSCRISLDRQTVAVNLVPAEEDIWANCPSVQRNMVRKALKRGLVCEELAARDGLSEFRRLYDRTMDRISARDYYHFSETYFTTLIGSLDERVKLFAVRDGNQIIAAALFLLHGDRIHYHLAGSDASFREYAPNNLLLHSVALWGHERGFRWLHLGGGRTPAPDDGLLRFKAGISKVRLPFYIGRRVHNQEVYEMLCSEWMRHKGVDERPSYFLLYRLDEDN